MGATYKNNIELTIFGESHGKAIGITIGNLPSGIQIDLDEVARDMKRRAPGQNKMSTARKEADQVEIFIRTSRWYYNRSTTYRSYL